MTPAFVTPRTGVFHIGLAVAMLITLVRPDGIFAVLAGFTAICFMHAANHLMDMHLGGTHSAPYIIAVQGLVSGTGAWLRARQPRR